MTSLPLRWIPIIGLLALLPVAAFWGGRGESVVALSAVSVLVIVGSLYRMLVAPSSPRSST